MGSSVRREFRFLVAFALAVSVTVGTDGHEIKAPNDLECYNCIYEMDRKADAQHCINPGPSTQKGPCDDDKCMTVTGYDFVSRFCWNSQQSTYAVVIRDLFNGQPYYTVGTSCNSPFCNDVPFTVPKYGQQVTCYDYTGWVQNPVGALDELCKQEAAGRCNVTSCQGFCYTDLRSDVDDHTRITLGCKPFCEDTLACCEGDLCNDNLDLKKVERTPITCYSCDNLTDASCLRQSPGGACSVTFVMQPDGSVISQRQSIEFADDYAYYNGSSKERVYIGKTKEGISKTLIKTCFTERCNYNTDIPETYESLLAEYVYNGGSMPSVASPRSSLQPVVGTSDEFLLPGASVMERSCKLLMIVCTIASILLGEIHV